MGLSNFLLRITTWDALLNQPLLTNSVFRDNEGKALDLGTHLAWGKLGNGPGAYVRTWIQF